MYCKHCGKEIADDSKFCQHCGGKLIEEQIKNSTWNAFFAKHKKLSFSYLLWLSLNLIALACGLSDPHRRGYGRFTSRRGEIDTSGFFPFGGGIDSYDFSEFIVFTIAIPLCLFAIIKLVSLFKKDK